jgi:hypothetical protein
MDTPWLCWQAGAAIRWLLLVYGTVSVLCPHGQGGGAIPCCRRVLSLLLLSA